MSFPLTILYGSATGNAEGIAKDLEELLTENNNAKLPSPFDSIVCKELDQFKKVGVGKAWTSSPSGGQGVRHGLIVVSSTTGNGDPPENANRFTRFIKKQSVAKGQDFQHVSYAVLGLGDTNYDQFCAMGKLIDKSLHTLGGHRAKPLACADEATGLEDVVEPWLESVVQDLAQACLGSNDNEESKTAETEEESAVEQTKPDTSTVPTSTPQPNLPPPPDTSDAPLYILYGSATGNAESIAKDLAETYETMVQNPDAMTFWKSVVCAELGQFKKLKLVEEWQKPACSTHEGVSHGVIIVASTTGNGDAPENAERFMRYLKKESKAISGSTTPKDPPFRNVSFSILGLGDTNYDQFCNTGKVLDKKFQELGGTRVLPLACADEATGLEDVVDGWTSKIIMEMTIACRGDTTESHLSTSSKQQQPIQITNAPTVLGGDDMDAQEEKKMDPTDVEISPLDTSTLSVGASMVRSLLCLDATSQLTKVDKSCLPQALSIRVKCECLDTSASEHLEPTSAVEVEDDDSVDGCHYSLDQPFISKIVRARYLTSTSVDGAKAIATNSPENEVDSRRILDNQFPIDTVNNSQLDVELNGKRVVEMTLGLPEDGTFEYQPGDSIGLVVTNTTQSVSFVLDMLRDNHGILENQVISIDGGAPVTVKDAIQDRIDLSSVIKNQKILYSLSKFATDPNDVTALEVLASKTDEGKELFKTYIDEQRRSIIDVLKDFPSCQKVTLEALLSVLPPIPPRYYSICSSPLDNLDGLKSLTVAFSVVDYMTPSLVDKSNAKELGCRRIHGLATGYLEEICAPFLASSSSNDVGSSSSLRIFPKPTQDFRLPSSVDTPIILIGPGTGIAPFMGFLAHRRALCTTEESKNTMCSNDVFFGCRHADHDWLYKTEMQTMVGEGAITNLYTAFSRDAKKDDGKKQFTVKYVQHIMTDNSECRERLVHNIMNQNGHVYICGDGNHMAKDVQEAIATVLTAHVEDNDGKAYIESMKADGRFLLDIWS